MEEINLKDFFDYYKKYLFIIVIVVLLSTLGMMAYNIWFKTPLYSTSTTVVLVKNDSVTDINDTIDQNDISLNQKLVSTYRQVIKSKLVLNQVIDDLDLDYSYDKLYSEIDVKSMEDTEILKITVTDENAKRAASIANKVANVFDKEVTQIYNISNVSVIDVAEVDYNPSNDHLIKDLVLAILVSFVIVSGIIFVIYYFDDTIRDIEAIEKDLEIPVVAKVFKDNNGIELLVDKKPNAATSESIRTLRTNLQFASVDEKLKTLLITSTLPGEGKSFISANLAISFAQTGKKVLLVDCDLRKGRQHRIFKVSGKNGLSNLLISDINDYKNYIVNTKIENLSIITRGIVPPNPSELLNSKKNKELIEKLSEDFDIVILDGAPITGLSDSLIISSLVNKVLLVTSINHTPKTEALNTKKALVNVGANLAGCVANNINAKSKSYGNYYYYNDYYYSDKGKRK